MPIVNALPNTIKNGELEDAVQVMANFNWLISQVNGNACPATSGSGMLKGNGTGGTSTAVAGTDYAGIGSVNTFTALQSGIAAVAAANFPIASQVQQSAFNTGSSGGTADAITVTFTPTLTSLTSAPIWWRATAANATTTPTLKRDGLAAKTIVKGSNHALVAGDIPGAGAWMCSQYDATLDKEVLLNPAYTINIAGGAAGSLPYQTAENTTSLLAIGTSRQFLSVAGGAPAWGDLITSGTLQTPSGVTSVDFAGIPSTAKVIVMMLSGISTNGTGSFWLQIGSGSIDTSGYANGAANITNASLPTTVSAAGNAAFVVDPSVSATSSDSGSVILTNMGSNIWALSGALTNTSTASIKLSAGSKQLSGALDRVRLTTSNGTDTFDSGSVNIMYE